MKKLVLALAVLFSVSMFSCGSSEKAEAADSTAVDTTVAVVEEVAAEAVVDTVNGDTTVAVAVEEAAAPVAE